MKKLIFSLLFLLISSALCTAQNETFLKVGDKAPELKVGSWIKNGANLGIGEGEISVVEFWATWCAPCIANFPHLSEVANDFKDQGVKVFGISVLERKETSLKTIRELVSAQGEKMDYNVGVDTDDKQMAENWLKAAGQRGIPYAIIVDGDGMIAWMGHPKDVEKPLEKMLGGTWDLEVEARKYAEAMKLKKIDGNEVISLLNPYMGKNYSGALNVIDSILEKHPKLKYYPNTGHFTFVSLVRADQEKAVEFARTWWEKSVTPNWKSVSDIIIYSLNNSVELPQEIWILGAEALQAQLDNYPWAMDPAKTYSEMADLYSKAGDTIKAEEMKKRAISYLNDN